MSTNPRLNFLPDTYVSRKSRLRTLTLAAGSLLMVATILTAATFHANASLRNAETRQSQIAREYDVADEQFQNFCKLKQSQQKVIERAAIAAAMVENVPRSNILAGLTDCLPTGVSLVDVNIESQPASRAQPDNLTGFDLKKSALKARLTAGASTPEPSRNVIVKLSGLAGSDVQIARFLSGLNQSPLFADARLLVAEPNTSVGRETQGERRFQMQVSAKAAVRIPPRAIRTEITTADAED